jgi:Trypsin
VSPEFLSLEGKPPPKQPETNSAERLASAELEERAESIVDYEAYLRQLAERIRTAPPERSSQVLEDIYVPPQVERLLEPLIGPSTSSTPSSLLIKYKVVGLAPATTDFPAVGAILHDDSTGSGGLISYCTGTLIAPDTVLTAAHCLDGHPLKVFFHHAGIYDILVNDSVANTDSDLGLIFLKQSVAGIERASINRSKPLRSGTVGLVIGFGYHSAKLKDPNSSPRDVDQFTGIKAYGTVVTSPCSGPSAGKQLICWNYTQPETFGSTCGGDSGGPLIAQINGDWQLAGVTSDVTSDCLPPSSLPTDVEVFPFGSWIDRAIDHHKPTAPTKDGDHYIPSLSAFDRSIATDISPNPFAMFADLNAANPSSLTFSRDYTSIRITLNATFSARPLQIKLTEAGGTLTKICPMESNESSTVVECSIAKPKKITYAVTVSGFISQEYQMVVDTFPK